jgi:hypothetical protein
LSPRYPHIAPSISQNLSIVLFSGKGSSFSLFRQPPQLSCS